MSVEIRGDKELIAELDAMLHELPPQAERVVSKGSVNIKSDWRRRVRGIAHAPRYGLSISYDITATDTSVTSVIGPVEGPQLQGFLGPVLEYGGRYNAPHPAGLESLLAEQPRYDAAVDAMVERLLR